MNFEFATATRLVFGEGKSKEIGGIAKSFGRRALVVIGQSAGAIQRVEPLLTRLTEAGVEYATLSVSGEPTVETARHGTERARQERCDLVIGFGGGSAIDTGKAVAALLTNPGDPLDYLEVIGTGKPITQPAAPFIAIPTTAGTGAEVTRNAVLGAPEHKVKVSLRSPFLLPRVALVDPELTHGLPPAITASSGLDALTQLIESFLSPRANPLTDAICRDGLKRVARSLRDAFDGPGSRAAAAREDMALAALFGGLALANAGLGAVHGLAGPLGGGYAAPHGALCAALLPHVCAINERVVEAAAEQRDEAGRVSRARQQRFQEVREIVGDIGGLVRALAIPPLRAYGIEPAEFPAIIGKAKAASSMQTNPVTLGDGELREILERAW